MQVAHADGGAEGVKIGGWFGQIVRYAAAGVGVAGCDAMGSLRMWSQRNVVAWY